MTLLQRIAALLVVLLLGYGWWLRQPAGGLEGALQVVLDGSPDRDQRLRELAIVRDAGLQAARNGDVRAGLLAAMASIDLEDAGSYRQAIELVGSRTAYLPGGGREDPELLEDAALGEPYLRALMLASAAEIRGDRASARRDFERARVSAEMFRAALGAELATAGLLRTR